MCPGVITGRGGPQQSTELKWPRGTGGGAYGARTEAFVSPDVGRTGPGKRMGGLPARCPAEHAANETAASGVCAPTRPGPSQGCRPMARAENLRSTTARIALPEALQKVMQHRSVDDGTARGLICEAHRFGALRFVISRPDGSLEHLSPRRYRLLSDDPCFDTGIIDDVPYPVKGRRGMPGSERCRVFVTQESLGEFLEIDSAPPAPAADAAQAQAPAAPPPEPAFIEPKTGHPPPRLGRNRASRPHVDDS
jgi:hypothetical protein